MVLANPIHNLTDLQQQSPLRKASSTTGIATRMLPLVLPLACYHSHATTHMLPLVLPLACNLCTQYKIGKGEG